VTQDDHHVALPKLFGAPAYARPPILVSETPRPLHADDLPLEVEQTPEEQDIYRSIASYEFGTVRVGDDGNRGAAEFNRAPDPDNRSFGRRNLGRIFG
jgi:hypothetical protein